MGAVVGMSAGVISSTVLIILSNPVWPGSTSPLGSLALDNPAIFYDPDRLPGLLPGHGALEGARQRAPVRGALRALGDRPRAEVAGGAAKPAPARAEGGSRAGAPTPWRPPSSSSRASSSRPAPSTRPATRPRPRRWSGRAWRRPGSRSRRTSSTPGRNARSRAGACRTGRRCASPGTSTPCRWARRGLVGRPVLGRDRRRPAVRARDERHEGRGGGDRGRGRAGGGAGRRVGRPRARAVRG